MKKFTDSRFRFSPEEITRKLTNKAQTAVKEHMPNYICFTRSDIFNITICMKRVCRDNLKEYYHMLKFAWDVAALDNNGYAVLIVPEEYKAIIMDALVNGANTKDQYQTLKDLMQWFNLRRTDSVKFNHWIPEDNRPGIYENDEYDGTKWYELIGQELPDPEESEEFLEEEYLKSQMEYSRD